MAQSAGFVSSSVG